MLTSLRNRQKGFTLIELLIVVAIIGIIAAILIPNFLDALHKGRQKRTMGDQRQFGLAYGQYATENQGAAAAGATTVDIADWTGAATTQELEDALVPTYTIKVPFEDGWGYPLEYHVTLTSAPAAGWALVRSPARDGAFEADTYVSGGFDPTDFGQDIVWADGGFLRAPNSVVST